MEDWAPNAYGDFWADSYDERFAGLSDTMPAADVLAELAAGGAVLELGVGTGRIALPLAERGVKVVGIDASERMLGKLLDKEESRAITVLQADFSDFDLDEKFSLIYISCNTLFDLPTQRAQVRCFQAAAKHLQSGGRFVIEACVPTQFINVPSSRAVGLDVDRAVFEAATHDPVTQQVFRQRMTFTPKGVEFGPIRNRYAWPSELDLMGQLAGLDLEVRWSGWERGGFVASSTGHVSVFRLPAEEL